MILLFLWLLSVACSQNIILVLLDDVDDLGDTRQGFPKTTAHFKENGTIFENAFVTTPICCPSRASILTGTYQHNHRTIDNTVKNGCDGPNWDNVIAPNSIGIRLQKLGYRTGMFGKYSNNYKGTKVPKGWDYWMGLEGNSIYYNYTLNHNGKQEIHNDSYAHDYLPDLLTNTTIDFIGQNDTRPWFAFLSVPTAHEPFDAAPQYQNTFAGSKPPNLDFPNFNKTGDAGKHWYTKDRPPMSDRALKYNLLGWERRLQALRSVDDNMMKILSLPNMNDTTVLFTSDNGFLFGEWGMILDKRQPYEITIRVPSMMSGPIVPKGHVSDLTVLNIDLAPTVLDVAQRFVPPAASQDYPSYGLSWYRYLNEEVQIAWSSLRQWIVGGDTELEFDGVSMVKLLEGTVAPRTSFLIEYHGMGDANPPKNNCSTVGTRCWLKDNTVWSTPPTFDIPKDETLCFCVDAKNNTYNCERRLGGEGPYRNYLHCEFVTEFREFYDVDIDPFQLDNIWGMFSEGSKWELSVRLEKFKECVGVEQCHQTD